MDDGGLRPTKLHFEIFGPDHVQSLESRKGRLNLAQDDSPG